MKGETTTEGKVRWWLLAMGVMGTVVFLWCERFSSSGPSGDAATNSLDAKMQLRTAQRQGESSRDVLRHLSPDRDKRVAELQGAEAMRAHYAGFFNSDNPGYSNILMRLKAVTGQEVLASDCFKDACAYVALRSEISNWVKEEEAHSQRLMERQVETITNTDALAKVAKANQGLLQSIQADFLQVPQAYRKVFAFRFQELHGLNAEAVLSELDQLTLSNAGPELIIPAP
jgi:hypothetical protein